MPKSRGFTLIELLVTITIIGILMAIGLTAYGFVVKQGRDSKRQSDLRAIQSALEQYYADQFGYPPASVMVFDGRAALSAGGRTYMNSLPADPKGTSPYRYIATPTTYCLFASLENPPSPAVSLPTGCAYPSTAYNFVVSPP